MKRFATIAWFALLASALTACGRRAELEACNIADASCQEDVYYAVVRLRGDGWDPFDGLPPIRTITLEQYRDELLGGRPRTPPDPDDGGEEEPEPVDPWGVALQWLGLITTETSSEQASVDNRVSNVAAYYSSREQRVTVIDRGQERNDLADTTLLVHELVHAFQDNEVRAAPVDRTTDGGFAGRAWIEGEAVLYENLARAELDQVAPEHLDWEGYYERWIENLRRNLPQEKSPYYAASWFVYPLGADRLMSRWLEGGNAAVRALGTDIPRSAVGYMAAHADVPIDDAPALRCRVEPPAEGFARVGYDRFGAMQLYAFVAGSAVAEADAWRAALAWRDDLLWVYFDEDAEQVAVSWRIRLASEDAADTVVEAARGLPMLRAERDGRDAVIVGSEADLEDWPGAAECD